MDILVCIPRDQENHVRATKLNPLSGLTHGYWTLSGHPTATRRGDRIWFSIYGQVIASAKIDDPRERWGEDEGRENRPAVCFTLATLEGHEFSHPREFPLSFRGFRYVRRRNMRSSARRTTGLEPVRADVARQLFPKS